MSVEDNFDWRQVLVGSLLILVLGGLVYSNTFDVPFVYDDIGAIVSNRDLPNFELNNWRSYFGVRALPQATLALNYNKSGLDVAAYHVINLVIHLIASLILFLFSYRLAGLWLKNKIWFELDFIDIDSRLSLALFSALLFLLHPLQTGSVTYIVQRITIMAAMFYLLSLWTFLEWRLSDNRRWWWAVVSWLAALAAMNSKEIAVTLPLAILWLEFTLTPSLRQGFGRQASRSPSHEGEKLVPLPSPASTAGKLEGRLGGVVVWKRLVMLLPWLILLLYIPWIKFGGDQLNLRPNLPATYVTAPVEEAAATDYRNPVLGQEGALPRDTYLYTQLGILPTYLKLVVWPAGLNVDHDEQVYNSLWSFRPLLGVGMVAVWLGLMWVAKSASRRLILFGPGFVLITMALESSFFPLAEVVAEYRLYLPMAGLALVAGGLLFRASSTPGDDSATPGVFPARIGAAVLIIALLGYLSYQRNEVWRDPLLLWQDAAAKSPNKSRPYNNLGTIYLQDVKDYEEAARQFERALAIDPVMSEALVNLGTAQSKLGQVEEAIANYKRAIELNPGRVAPKTNLGKIYLINNRMDEAKASFEDAIATDPWFVESYNGLGAVYVKLEEYDLAREQFEKALELKPDYPSAINNLRTIDLLDRGWR